MFIVIELQTTDGQTANIVTAYTDKADADAKFHQIMAAAAKSSVGIHAAVIMDETGMSIRQEAYRHSGKVEEQ